MDGFRGGRVHQEHGEKHAHGLHLESLEVGPNCIATAGHSRN